MADNIEERVTKIIAEQLGVDYAEVKPETHFVNDLGADSLDLIEALIGIEDDFAIEIPDADLANVHTLAQAIELVRRLTA